MNRILMVWMVTGVTACSGDIASTTSASAATQMSAQTSTSPAPLSVASSAAAVSDELPVAAAGIADHAASSVSDGTTAAPRLQSRIYLDPQNGLPRAPTAAEQASEATLRASSKSINAVRSSVKTTALPNGITEYDLGDAGRVQENVCLHPDGSMGECNAQQLEELRAKARQRAQ